jgi:putative nucleotidyltransferase with HDIG domain
MEGTMIRRSSAQDASDPVSWLTQQVLAVASPGDGFVTPDRRGRATRALLEQLRRHHAPTALRSVRVARVLTAMAEPAPELLGDAETVLLAGALHDIGKLFVPAELLGSARGLSVEDWAAVRCHPEAGARLLTSLGFPPLVICAARDHHERWDGGGYPSGKPSSGMHPLARAVAVADAFVAMVEPQRTYRPPMTREAALAEIARCRGTQFEPAAADLLLAAFGDQHPQRFALAVG